MAYLIQAVETGRIIDTAAAPPITEKMSSITQTFEPNVSESSKPNPEYVHAIHRNGRSKHQSVSVFVTHCSKLVNHSKFFFKKVTNPACIVYLGVYQLCSLEPVVKPCRVLDPSENHAINSCFMLPLHDDKLLYLEIVEGASIIGYAEIPLPDDNRTDPCFIGDIPIKHKSKTAGLVHLEIVLSTKCLNAPTVQYVSPAVHVNTLCLNDASPLECLPGVCDHSTIIKGQINNQNLSSVENRSEHRNMIVNDTQPTQNNLIVNDAQNNLIVNDAQNNLIVNEAQRNVIVNDTQLARHSGRMNGTQRDPYISSTQQKESTENILNKNTNGIVEIRSRDVLEKHTGKQFDKRINYPNAYDVNKHQLNGTEALIGSVHDSHELALYKPYAQCSPGNLFVSDPIHERNYCNANRYCEGFESHKVFDRLECKAPKSCKVCSTCGKCKNRKDCHSKIEIDRCKHNISSTKDYEKKLRNYKSDTELSSLMSHKSNEHGSYYSKYPEEQHELQSQPISSICSSSIPQSFQSSGTCLSSTNPLVIGHAFGVLALTIHRIEGVKRALNVYCIVRHNSRELKTETEKVNHRNKCCLESTLLFPFTDKKSIRFLLVNDNGKGEGSALAKGIYDLSNLMIDWETQDKSNGCGVFYQVIHLMGIEDKTVTVDLICSIQFLPHDVKTSPEKQQNHTAVLTAVSRNSYNDY